MLFLCALVKIGDFTITLTEDFNKEVFVEVAKGVAENMLVDYTNVKVYLACGATDMRKSINGLSAIVQQDFNLDPFEKALFVFCNRHW